MGRVKPVLLFLVLVPVFGMAQSAKDSWDNLKQLQPGQKIEVVDKKMKTSSGAFVALSDDSITLREKKSEQSIARADVMRVSIRDNSHRTRNMLLGAGILGGIALIPGVICLRLNSDQGNYSSGACVAVIAAGFGGGAAIGAITPSGRTLYRVKK